MPTTPYLITDKRTGKTFNRDLDDEQIGAIPENFSATPSAFAAQDPSFADDRPDAQPEPIAQPEYEPPIGVTDFAEFEQVEPDEEALRVDFEGTLPAGSARPPSAEETS